VIVGPLRRVLARLADKADYALTTSRLWLLDRWLDPSPETPEDRAIREEGERLRRAFPAVDFDDPKPRTMPSERR